MIKILLLSRYGPLGASSRVRFLQYLPYLRSQGVEVTVKPLLSDAYLLALYNGGSRWREVIKGYGGRVRALLGARRFDIVIIEKELFPFFPAIAERFLKYSGVPYVVDYDDALFHRYDCHSNRWVRFFLGKKIDSVMRNASTVIAGNSYLAKRAYDARVNRMEIIPTVVDAKLYKPKQKEPATIPIVGWIGTPQTSRYLKSLLPVFESIRSQMPVRFVAIGARPEDFDGTVVETWPWSEKSEVESIQKFDIGIMPLLDSPWERGKCGYKLIQYMACGVPVIASPVGVNCEIVDDGANGRFASETEEWDTALRDMLGASPESREKMGIAGRARVEQWYSLQAQAPRFYKVLREAQY